MYELLYIVSPSFTDPEVEEVKKKVENLITSEGGEVKAHQTLTKQALAYPVKRMKHGIYVLMHFILDGNALAKVERTLRLDFSNEILRHLASIVTEKEANSKFDLEPYTYPLADKERKSQTHKQIVRELPPPVPVSVDTPKMTVEELDKKLDEILDDETLGSI
jgi:small subunit ribosomal protein S6